MSGDAFGNALAAFAEKSGRGIHATRRAVAIKLFSAVIKDTPVGDEEGGRLRGNWQTSIGQAKEEQLPIRSEGATVAELVEVVGHLTADEPIILRNNMPYGPRIEYEGWSHTKAPEGMVRKNVARFVRLLTEEVARIKAGGK